MAITYKDAGVDKEAGYKQVKLIKETVKATHIEGVLNDIGGFAGMFDLGKLKMENPVLVSGTDGVGSKVQIAQMMDIHNTVGEDCVAMCVNDILCQGAKPIFFLDYIATGKLVPEKMAAIVEGVASGCKKAGAALLGGETAEMPGIYKENDYDLAGFAVGVVEKDKIIDGSKISEGDVLLGLPSSGVHSNGYSLVRKIIFDHKKMDLNDYIDDLGTTLGEALLVPTKIYVKDVYPLIEKYEIKGLCHITGGGIYENLPRILPEGHGADVDMTQVEIPKIFKLLQEWGGIETKEMYGTFNMGLGMVLVVSEETAQEILSKEDQKLYRLGKVTKGDLCVEI
ncbi:phosphoribosylformylglycinamidine cyclo-ligase [Neofamilia massiliensis]|uniref:phosphoribosylformylglycinamidine cyclo-ligase n=1 Tax=Neofamilia massiliensis TaxID=1673724 RepID=UPI0006BB5BE2|nr:phosphoribosylformylglycinamidine cyclo-ligase [Neofamilia massiliensis]